MADKIDIAKQKLIEEFVRNWSPQQEDIENKMKEDLSKLIDVYANNQNDPKYMNIPNICFSLTEPTDDREEKFREQRISRGFDDSETWSLKDTIANFILPRLRRHREIIEGTIMDTYDLYEKIDLSIRAFEIVVKDGNGDIPTEEEWEEYDKGMTAFADVYMRLWW